MTHVLFFQFCCFVLDQSKWGGKSWKYWQDMVLGMHSHSGLLFPHLKGNRQKESICHVKGSYCHKNLLAETTSRFGREYPQSNEAQNILRKNVTFVFKLCMRIPVPLATYGGQQARTSNICVSTSLHIWCSVVHLLILFLKYHCSCVVWSQYALVYVPSCTVISKHFLLLRAVCVYVSFCMKHFPLSLLSLSGKEFDYFIEFCFVWRCYWGLFSWKDEVYTEVCKRVYFSLLREEGP